MKNILDTTHYRRNFFVFAIFFVLAVLLIRFLLLPYFDCKLETSKTIFCAIVLENLVSEFIVVVLIACFIFYLTPPILKKSNMKVISPKEIGTLLKKAVIDTRSWKYKGACGRYTRAVTLPSLAIEARNEGIGRDIIITILNPANDHLCSEYATYRRSLKSANQGDPWTKEKVKEEVISTVLSALRFKYEEPLLTIDIFLIDHFSAFRLDISDSYAIVTKEDKEASGLRADNNTYFYDSYIDDIRLSNRQSKEIIFNSRVPDNSELTNSILTSIILELELVSESELRELNLDSILQGIVSPINPYS